MPVPVTLNTRTVLEGGEDKIVPMNRSKSGIVVCSKITLNSLMEYSEYYSEYLKDFRGPLSKKIRHIEE